MNEHTEGHRPISPDQVAGKEFVVTLRGYDKTEVDGFLREVADDYRTALDAGNANADAVLEVQVLRQAAADAADELMRQAEAQAAELRAQAEAQADLLRTSALAHAEQLRAAAAADAGRAVAGAREKLQHLASCERVARTRLSSLRKVLDEALASPVLEGAVLDLVALERRIEEGGTAEGDAEVIDLREAALERAHD
jgi:DivIVA domain-containing protein